jgi:segregation and condensation protein A
MVLDVHTSVYEGPFDLLLHLILKQEVDLWEVSLSGIIDQYLAELDRMDSLDLDVATEFLLIAATLVELKARRLLPGVDDGELDEELLRFEERDLLLARLLECKTFKDASLTLDALARRAARSVPRLAGPEEPYRWLVPDPLERIRPAALRAAALRVLAAKPEPVVDTEHIAPVRASVRDAVESLLRLLPATESMSFRALVAGVDTRLEVVVRFLAVLELYKQGLVDILQFQNFGELLVRRLGEGEVALDMVSLDDWDDEPAVGATDDEPVDEPDEPSHEFVAPLREGAS